MQAQVSKECEVFNCDKRHGNYCCYYCAEHCSKRCLNNPNHCGLYLKPQKYRSWYTQKSSNGVIDTGEFTIDECLRKLSDYEATGLQPQDVVALQYKHIGGGLK